MTRVVVAGGGIVGLTVGLGLRRAGFDVLVTEQADRIRAEGATLGLWDNALRVFDDLGLRQGLERIGRPAEMYFHDPSGHLLTTPDFGPADHEYFLVHRAELNELLATSVDHADIRVDARVVGFEERADRVVVQFGDGATEDADLLIGADGLHSTVRAQLVPGTEAVAHAGHRAWRAVIQADGLSFDRDVMLVGGAHRTRGGYARTHDGQVFWLISQFDSRPPDGSVKDECLARAWDLTDGTWDCAMSDLVKATDERRIIYNQIMVVPVLDRWVSDRVALIGDAAHAMSPHITAGASLGVEDVDVLCRQLRDGADIPSALKAYEADRLPRYREVATLSKAVEAADTAAEFARRYAAFSHWMITPRSPGNDPERPAQ